MGSHVAPLKHIILTQSQPAFALTPYCIVLRGEATYTKFIVLSLAQPCLEPTINHTQREHANNYITDQVVE